MREQAVSLPFSRLEEPRDFMTSIVLLVFVAVAAEQSRTLASDKAAVRASLQVIA